MVCPVAIAGLLTYRSWEIGDTMSEVGKEERSRRYCTKCGAQVSGEDAFCASCGSRLSSEAASTSGTAQASNSVRELADRVRSVGSGRDALLEAWPKTPGSKCGSRVWDQETELQISGKS